MAEVEERFKGDTELHQWLDVYLPILGYKRATRRGRKRVKWFPVLRGAGPPLPLL